jgi:hypothetical protein
MIRLRTSDHEPPLNARATPWWWILVLYVPVVLYYASHYAAAFIHPGLVPTGFVQYDLPYTMACAREFADNGLHGLLFTLPSDAHADGEPVLLQLHMWLLGQVWRVLPMDPGSLYVLFGLAVGLFAVRAFTRLFDEVVPVSGAARKWGQVLFLWGGGMLAFAGEAVNLVHGRPLADTWKYLLDIDPAHGWWMMSLGRCLILPNEAWYHLLYFTTALALLRKRYRTAVICLLVLAASHPFAGVGALMVFLAWAFVERVSAREKSLPLFVPVALVGALLACCAYYFIWLPPRMDPHLVSALPLPYIVEGRAILPAYALVLLIACARLRSKARLSAFLRDPAGRMLAVMVVVHLALENHELFMPAYQPAHFTRGYTWAALFLTGAPWLLDEAWPRVRERWRRGAAGAALAVVLLFLSDNTAFFALNIKRQLRASPPGFWLTTEQREVLRFLGTLPPQSPLVISQDEDLGYMVIVYTPLRAYRSHFFDEADAWSRVKQQAAWFEGRVTDPLLAGPLIAVAMKDGGGFVPAGRSGILFENRNYIVFATR